MKRFPFGLTLAAGIAFAILIGLGAWQMQRLTWKEALLAKIEALQHAPPASIAAVARRIARGEDLNFTRISAACTAPTEPPASIYRYAVHDGRVAWRLLSPCRLATGGYDGVVVDRGVVERLTGAMTPSAAVFAEPTVVTGVLRAPGARPMFDSGGLATAGGVASVRIIDHDALMKIAAAYGLHRPMPYLLAAESETPAPAGITPAALPQDIPNNHYVYALTWFALAGILAWFYGALVWRRMTTA